MSSVDSENSTTVGLVILTTGDRGEDLATIMDAAAALPFDERVLVGNGVVPPLMEGWRSVEAPENLGVPGGRSFGIGRSSSDVIIFLDDDSRLPASAWTLVEDVRQVFDDDPAVGALALRVVVTGTDETLRRWSPRPSRRAANSLTDVPTFPGNGHALRRSAFDDVGGYLNELFFKHEETDLSWRLLDNGWRVVTEPKIVVEHPNTSESRHGHALELGLRNKLWIARLRLPAPIAFVNSAISTARSLARCRSASDLRAVGSGFRSGLAALPAARDPVSWSTVVKLTRAGRPPLF